MSEHFELHVEGGLLLPMEEPGVSFRGDLLIRGGRIVRITRGPAAGVSAQRRLDAAGCAVLPGFVQGHVHVVQSLLRHQADELELLDWLRNATWPYEAALDGDGVRAAAELGIAELLCGGTTSALDFGTTHHHEEVFEAAAALGIRFVSGKTHMDRGEDVPRGLLEDTERSLRDAADLGTRWHGAANGRLRYAVAPRFALSCSAELLRACVELARGNGWLLQSHASENRAEVAAVRELTGQSNIEYLDRVGLTGRDVVLAHGVHLEAHEIALLSATGTGICHCPGANLKLASGIADIPALLAAGVRVGLGADGPPCNNRLSMFHEMALAATLHSLRYGPRAIGAWQALHMATRGGAELLGLDDEIGSLTVGKAADVVAVSLDDWSLLPAGDPASRLVFGASAQHVRHVVVDGAVLVENREMCDRARAARIREACRDAWQATAARMEVLR